MKSPGVRTVVRVLLIAVELVGGVLLGMALNSSASPPPPAESAVYATTNPCLTCQVILGTVQVEQRDNGVLFVVRGRLPSSLAGLTSAIRLQADGLDVVLSPAHGTVVLSHAVLNGRPLDPSMIAAGIQDDALLLFVRQGVLTQPVQFALGTWNGSIYASRLPTSGTLVWSAQGLAHDTNSAASSSTSSTPSTSAAETAVTSMADTCASIPSGQAPAALAIGAIASGNRTDPRRLVPVNWVGLTYATPLPGQGFRAQPPYSATIVIDEPGKQLPRTGPAIDRLGELQFWAIWNGTQLAKAVREWNGSNWTTLVDAAADPMTLDMSSTGVTFYWPGLRAGDRAAAVIAVDGGCSAYGLSAAGRATVAVTP